jgi:phytoene dehydrogenase-like protein
MMKTIVIGSGVAGLTVALTLLRAGQEVEIFEQAAQPGGVTQGLEQDGFQWDYGQLNFEGLSKADPLGRVLNDLGVLDHLTVFPDHRDYIFPDFDLRAPAEYAGPKWRIDKLKTLFPEETKGLDRYWKDYIRFTRLVTLGGRLEKGGFWAKIPFFAALLPPLSKLKWSAEKLLDHYFKSDKLKAVFVSILADFFTPPSQFQGLGVFALNSEKAYDERIPAHLARNADCIGLYTIAGGTKALTDAFVEEITNHGGSIHLNRTVKQINVANNHVTGVTDQTGKIYPCDCILASGGARETLIDLLEPGTLPEDFTQKVKAIPLMDSVFMLHLGVDHAWPEVLRTSSTYFYGSYDIEGQVKLARDGIYHEGAAGFVVHVPKMRLTGADPKGRYAMTIYTICPERLNGGNWQQEKERFADKLLEYAEERLAGLRKHIKTAIIVTPDEFRQITYLQHHAFGGIAPILGAWKVPHQTPVKGLWFIGAQSESGGGINAVVPAAHRIAMKAMQTQKETRTAGD